MVLAEQESAPRSDAIRANYLEFYNQSSQFVTNAERYLTRSSYSLQTRLDVLSDQSLRFMFENRKNIFSLKGEILRNATLVESPEFSIEDENVFNPINFRTGIRDWTQNVMYSGLEQLRRRNVLHIGNGNTISFDQKNILGDLVDNVSMVYWFPYHSSFGIDYEATNFAVDRDQALDNFLQIGTDTFSIVLTTLAKTYLDRGYTEERCVEKLRKAIERGGLVSQLMRMGGDITNDFTEEQIDQKTFTFQESAPIIFDCDDEILIDSARANSIYQGIVNIENPETIKVKGKLICPAAQTLNVGENEQDMIILYLLNNMVSQVKPSYFKSPNTA